jgi:hypothetical protein
VTTTLSPPIRVLALVGVLAAIGIGVFMFTQSRSNSSSSSSLPAADSTSQPAASQLPAKTVSKTATKPAKPKLVLVPGLPTPIAHALRNSKVVVVALYAHGAKGDKAVVARAKQGAKSAHSGFAAVNVVDEITARKLGKFAGTNTAPPAILVVKRPGKIVNQFSGQVDDQIVAQAAVNAGAGR